VEQYIATARIIMGSEEGPHFVTQVQGSFESDATLSDVFEWARCGVHHGILDGVSLRPDDYGDAGRQRAETARAIRELDETTRGPQ